jgi:hypothetical protein
MVAELRCIVPSIGGECFLLVVEPDQALSLQRGISSKRVSASIRKLSKELKA